MLRVVQKNKRLISEEKKKKGKAKEINQPDPALNWRLPTSANPAPRLGGSFLHGDRLCLRMFALWRHSDRQGGASFYSLGRPFERAESRTLCHLLGAVMWCDVTFQFW